MESVNSLTYSKSLAPIDIDPSEKTPRKNQTKFLCVRRKPLDIVAATVVSQDHMPNVIRITRRYHPRGHTREKYFALT